jgi:hypothetical protein
VCGWLYDAETDAALGTITTDWADCDDLSPRPTTGPCALQVSAYDALMFFGNPTGTAPMVPERYTLNTCGQFVLENFAAPALGFMAIAVDDHGSSGDEHWVSAVPFPSMAGLRRDDVELFAVRHNSNQKWTTSAGDPFGTLTFGDRGAYLPIFRHRGVAVAGVSIPNTESFYFSDTNSMRTTVAPAQTSTGTNGSALVVDEGAFTDLCGEGSEAALQGCQWPCPQGGSVPGLYVVRRNDSVDMGLVCR